MDEVNEVELPTLEDIKETMTDLQSREHYANDIESEENERV